VCGLAGLHDVIAHAWVVSLHVASARLGSAFPWPQRVGLVTMLKPAASLGGELPRRCRWPRMAGLCLRSGSCVRRRLLTANGAAPGINRGRRRRVGTSSCWGRVSRAATAASTHTATRNPRPGKGWPAPRSRRCPLAGSSAGTNRQITCNPTATSNPMKKIW
jgi:hypothetical protein